MILCDSGPGSAGICGLPLGVLSAAKAAALRMNRASATSTNMRIDLTISLLLGFKLVFRPLISHAQGIIKHGCALGNLAARSKLLSMARRSFTGWLLIAAAAICFAAQAFAET